MRRRGAENGRPYEQHTFQGSDAQDRRRLRAPCRVGRRTRKALGIRRKLGKKFTSARAPPPQKAEPAQPSGIASKKYFGRARRYVTCVTFANASLCHSSKPQCELIAFGQAGRRTHGECTQLLSRSRRRAPGDRPTLELLRRLGCLLLR